MPRKRKAEDIPGDNAESNPKRRLSAVNHLGLYIDQFPGRSESDGAIVRPNADVLAVVYDTVPEFATMWMDMRVRMLHEYVKSNASAKPDSALLPPAVDARIQLLNLLVHGGNLRHDTLMLLLGAPRWRHDSCSGANAVKTRSTRSWTRFCEDSFMQMYRLTVDQAKWIVLRAEQQRRDPNGIASGADWSEVIRIIDRSVTAANWCMHEFRAKWLSGEPVSSAGPRGGGRGGGSASGSSGGREPSSRAGQGRNGRPAGAASAKGPASVPRGGAPRGTGLPTPSPTPPPPSPSGSAAAKKGPTRTEFYDAYQPFIDIVAEFVDLDDADDQITLADRQAFLKAIRTLEKAHSSKFGMNWLDSGPNQKWAGVEHLWLSKGPALPRTYALPAETAGKPSPSGSSK